MQHRVTSIRTMRSDLLIIKDPSLESVITMTKTKFYAGLGIAVLLTGLTFTQGVLEQRAVAQNDTV